MVNKDWNGRKLAMTRIGNTTFIDHPKKLTIGNNVYIGHYNFLEASNHLTIGEGCQITNYINITTHSSHNSIRLYGKKYTDEIDHVGYLKGPVSIGKYTFVGPYVVIMPGTKIGKGCIVSAYSYVQGDFPDFSIIKGNPAKVIGDTREQDKTFLCEHPELYRWYNEWTTESE